MTEVRIMTLHIIIMAAFALLLNYIVSWEDIVITLPYDVTVIRLLNASEFENLCSMIFRYVYFPPFSPPVPL